MKIDPLNLIEEIEEEMDTEDKVLQEQHHQPPSRRMTMNSIGSNFNPCLIRMDKPVVKKPRLPRIFGWSYLVRRLRKETFVVDPTKGFFYKWLLVISLAILYNTIMIIARSVFWQLNNSRPWTWFILDYTCDAIYILDMIVNSRTGYLEQGLLVRDSEKLLVNYLKGWQMKLDILSLIPTDLFYISTGISCIDETIPCPVILRLNRLFKIYRQAEFFDRTETRTNFPNVFRVSKLVFIILVVIHWNGCLYFAVSYMIGFGTDRWVYNNTAHPGLAHQYIYCIYWSTMTLTAIGEAADPVRDEEYLFQVIDYLIGILIFATIVGNVGSMISNMNAARVEFQSRMDAVKQYMEFRKVDKELQHRVIKWFDYLWSNKQLMDEDAVTSVLPDKLKAEIAIQVHLETLKKVHLFQDCEFGLLQILVLKLRLQVFSPGDVICRKGDVGKEMYIVKRGRLSVVGEDGHTVFATLSDGAVFGELSVLNIAGNKTGNRRTANVRSVGYSDLFVLSKDDLWDALQDYPDAKELLIERGKTILRKDNLLDEEALKKSQVEHKKIIERSEKLADGLEQLQTNFTKLLDEYISAQKKLKKRINRLENISNVSPWGSQALGVPQTPTQLCSLSVGHSPLQGPSPLPGLPEIEGGDPINMGRSVSLKVRPRNHSGHSGVTI